MSYCLNPDCPAPENPADAITCQACGSPLVLKGRYRAIKPIGKGNFGRTFQAVDESIPSRPLCVIKLFQPQVITSPEQMQKAVALFEQEAVQLDRLGHHPQIPDLLAYFILDGRPYLVQKFIDGQDLAQELLRQGPFDETKIRQLLADLLPVLDYIHKEKVIHRDIKPKNIIRQTADQRLFLVDFGAVKFVQESGLFKTGTAIGSSGFAAPEQMMGKAVYASDLYSLGATCIYLLTGISPAKLFNIRENVWLWREALKQPLSDGLMQFLDKLLQRLPGQRFASAEQALEALQRLEQPARSVSMLGRLGLPGTPLNPLPGLGRFGTSPPVTLKGGGGTLPPGQGGSAGTFPPGQPPRAGVDTGRLRSPVRIGTPTPPPQVTTVQAELLWPCVHTLTGHTHWVKAICFSPDSRYLFSCGRDGLVLCWSLNSPGYPRQLQWGGGHAGGLHALALSPDGRFLAAAGEDRVIKIWQLPGDKPVRTLGNLFNKHGGTIDALAMRPDGLVLASASEDQTVKLWQVDNGALLTTLSGHASHVRGVTFTPDGRLVVSASWDNSVKVWLLEGGDPLRNIVGPSSFSGSGFNAVAVSPNGRVIAAGGEDTAVHLWHLHNGDPIATLTGHREGVRSVAYSPQGRYLASGGWEGEIRVWDTQSWTLLMTLTGHEKGVTCLAFSPDQQWLASGSRDNSIRLWRVVK
ncbi:MAG: serine/threonine protein kinase [Gloeomargarita sp. SKYB31]|nr:serine/threonine protein kinase [Gloeomargarita sp. SKYB31]